MKAKSVIKLVLSLLVIAILVFLTAFGIKLGNYELKPAYDGIKLGLDINGGSYIEYQAVERVQTAEGVTSEGEDKKDVTQEEIDTTIAILRARATSEGYTEANVMHNGNGRFRVELPSVGDANQASTILGQVAELTFEDPENNVVLDGNQIKNATAVFSSTDGTTSQHIVELEFTEEGRQKFAEATARLVGQQISIKLDGVVQSAPTVQEAIDSDKAIITLGTGEGVDEYARSLAGLIRSGKLPFGLKEVGASTVSATLGQDAYQNALLAGLISIILIAIFMIAFYRLPGLMGAIALIFYTVLTILILGAFGVNLTLPGIAGIVLSLGMAVDANVIIFERITDEMKNGKTLRASIDAGFNRALTAVVDSNITTLISAGVLWALGSGTVKGFAITLFLGVVVSMFTAVFVTKFLIKQLIGLDIKNRKLYGIGIK